MGQFGTQINPAHYVEVPDPLNAGQTKRPDAGAVLKARNYVGAGALGDITVQLYGYWFADYPGVDLIQVSGDGGATWVGPLQSGQSLVDSTTSGANASTALSQSGQALTTANQALTTAQNGPAATWDNISGKPTTFPPSLHTHTASQISNASAIGQQVLTAADPQTARAAIGAGTGNGTSNLTLGTTATTAAAGNHSHTASTLAYTPQGSITATDVQTAIQQASATGGGGAGGVSPYKPVLYISGAYETLPATPDPAWRIIEYRGPVTPSPPYTVPAYSGIQFDWLVRGT